MTNWTTTRAYNERQFFIFNNEQKRMLYAQTRDTRKINATSIRMCRSERAFIRRIYT